VSENAASAIGCPAVGRCFCDLRGAVAPGVPSARGISFLGGSYGRHAKALVREYWRSRMYARRTELFRLGLGQKLRPARLSCANNGYNLSKHKNAV
jgi:hypothetical protein